MVLATSICPKDLERQKSAVNSWRDAGFDVVSLNCREEISDLAKQFPEIAFVAVGRDSRSETEKPLIYFDSFIEYFRRSDSQICGIVNSDIVLRVQKDFIPFVEREAKNCMLTGCRVDIEDSHCSYGSIFVYGLDYFSSIDLYWICILKANLQ